MMRRNHAFTLLELLVVIAIIGVLLALLVPLMQSMREHAKVAVCLANLQQMGPAFHMYANDNAERLPPASADPTRIATVDSSGQRGGIGILYPDYVGTWEVFYCPTTKYAHKSWNNWKYWDPNPYEAERSNGQQAYRYLGGREFIDYKGGRLKPYDSEKTARTHVTEESHRTLVADAFEKYNSGNYKANHTWTGEHVTPISPKGCGFLFIDGHARFVWTGNDEPFHALSPTGWCGKVYMKSYRGIWAEP